MAMNPADPTHQRIDTLVKSNPVLLFMKGNRTFPKCGFSASVIGVLDELARSEAPLALGDIAGPVSPILDAGFAPLAREQTHSVPLGRQR